MRLFIACYLSSTSHQALIGKKQNFEHHLKGKFVPDNQLHITITFLDEVEPSYVPTIIEVVKNTPLKHTTLNFKQFFTFIVHKKNTLIAELENDQSLTAFKVALDKQLQAIGLTFNQRQFIPHITLARRIVDHERLNSLQKSLFEPLSLDISHVAIMKSTLHQNGAYHEELYKKIL